jgi:hypothetical protein
MASNKTRYIARLPIDCPVLEVRHLAVNNRLGVADWQAEATSVTADFSVRFRDDSCNRVRVRPRAPVNYGLIGKVLHTAVGARQFIAEGCTEAAIRTKLNPLSQIAPKTRWVRAPLK